MNATDAHYTVTNGAKKGERIIFGWNLPLTQGAARKYANKVGGRAIKRTTARKLGLI